MKVFHKIEFLRHLKVFDIEIAEIPIHTLFRDKLAPLSKWRILPRKSFSPVSEECLQNFSFESEARANPFHSVNFLIQHTYPSENPS